MDSVFWIALFWGLFPQLITVTAASNMVNIRFMQIPDFANSNLTLFTSNTKPESRVKEDSGYAERHHDGTNADRLSKRKPRRVFSLGLLYFPSDPPAAIFIVVA